MSATGNTALGVGDTSLRLAAAGAVAATLLSFAARAWWVLELFTHFRLQLSLVSVLLAAALLWRRHRIFALALAGTAVANAAPLAAYLTTGTAAAAIAGTGGFDVLSANVLWRNHDYADLLDIIETRKPDAVVALEFTPAWRKGLAALDERYPYRLLAPHHDPYGIGLWSRYPLEAKLVPLQAAVGIDALVQTPAGEIRLIGVHLRSPTTRTKAAERDRQFSDLTDLARGSPVPLVVVGDFNTTPYSPYFSDWLESAGLRNVHTGLDDTWPTFLPILRIPIDHCVVSPKIGGAELHRLRAFGSDHFPILCRLNLGKHR
ncbi:MAG TPA: endonuclease/exonuclease/phosphatase family protein [Gammaproteobacteria bacterium]|nr:endonuclease/exonuclease/phosphatase family protein [Gammaproteobacteria bacterium]